MDKEEFIKWQYRPGAETRSAAEHYVNQHDKPEYTTEDFIDMYHTSMHWCGVSSDKGLSYAYGVKGRTTAFSNGIVGNSGSGQDWR